MDAALDFLSNSLLGDPRLIERQYRNISNRVLENEVTKYLSFAVQRCPPTADTELGVYAPGRGLVEAIRVHALYSDSVSLDDPIAGWADLLMKRGLQKKWMPNHHHQRVGFPGASKQALASKVAGIMRYREAFESGFVTYLPAMKPREEPLPLIFSNDNFFSLLPRSILDAYRIRASPRTVIYTPDGRSLVLTELRKCGHGEDVHVGFEGDWHNATGFTVPDDIVNATDDDFMRFVDGCINRGAWMKYCSLMRDADVAAQYCLRLSARSQLDAEIMTAIGRFESNDFICSALPDLRVPILEDVSVKNLLKIRSESRSFIELRSKLRESLSRARSITGRAEAIDDVSAMLAEDVVRAEDDLKAFRKSAGLASAAAFAVLSIAASWSPLAVLALAAGLWSNLKSVFDDERVRRRSPGYCIYRAIR